jgi:NADPH:quinone reductase-like Zn-dependent oxidoreductase
MPPTTITSISNVDVVKTTSGQYFCSIQSYMKAIVLKEAGTIENFSIEEIEKPLLGPNDVLIEAMALSINPVDFKTRKGGALYENMQKEPPVILGWDISGRVDAVGEAVQQFKVGDEVFGMVNFPGHGKAYAQYVAAPEKHVALKPASISHQDAAATTLAALTAWQVLVQQAGLQTGHRVLIHAAAGGVGHFAVQIAKHLGAYVIGTASAKNIAFVQSLGADEVVDYTQTNFEEVLHDVDMVLDPLGGEVTRRSTMVVKEGGVIISIVGGVKDYLKPLLEEKNIRAANYLVQSNGEDMQTLAKLLEQGAIKPVVSHQYAFEEMGAAHEQMETSRTKGKIIINVK